MRYRSHGIVKEYTLVHSTHTCTHPRQQARGMKPRSAQPQSRTPTPTNCAPQTQLSVHRTFPDPSRRLDLCLSFNPSHKLSPPAGSHPHWSTRGHPIPPGAPSDEKHTRPRTHSFKEKRASWTVDARDLWGEYEMVYRVRVR